MDKKVKIYTTSTCPHCIRLKAFLDEKKVPYEAADVGTDRSAVEEMIRKSGQMGVPVVDIEGKIIVGFDRAAIAQELGIPDA